MSQNDAWHGIGRTNGVIILYVLGTSRLKASYLSEAVANNFWGKEDAGVQPLLERMHNAKVTSDELKLFYNSMLHIY